MRNWIRKIGLVKNQRYAYAIEGAMVGLSIPVIGLLLEGVSGMLGNAIHSPAVWVLCLAPILFGIFAYKEGAKRDREDDLLGELKEKYAHMKELRDVADKANRSKSEFLANMSHEIRTPMNAIIGMNYLLGKTGLRPKQADYVRKMDMSSKNLLRIIDDILDFSKIEAGKLTLEMTDMRLEDLMTDLADTLNVKLQRKTDVELITSLDPKIPRVIIGDPVRLRQVLLNLSDNAIKFTEKGEVSISMRCHAQLDYGIIIEFTVRDSGIGMSAQQVTKLFNPFQQADLSTTRKYGGTGLGLAICKRIVELMDGELEVKSAPGEGTQFRFHSFFSTAPVQEDMPDDTVEALVGLKALLVDDSEQARLVMNDMLCSLGFEVTEAASSNEAILLYEEAARNRAPFSLLLVDWRMPGMDGLELVAELKAHVGIPVPSVVMATAYGLDAVKQAPGHEQVDAFLLKPINPSTLFDTLNQVMHLGAVKMSTHSGHESIGSFRMKLGGAMVLVVEDNDINLELAEELLKDVGIRYETARHGEEAIEKLTAGKFDAVLMDIQMPVMDGLTATREIRAMKGFTNLPIIAMTAHAMKGEHEKSIAAGMNDHITKPIDPIILYSRLAEYIKPDPARLASLPVLESDVTGAESEHFRIDGIDTTNGLRRVAGNAKVYRKLLGTFLRNYSDFRDQIERMRAGNEVTELSKYLHTLAGVAGNIGMEHIHRASNPLSHELRGVDGASLEKVPILVEDKLRNLARDMRYQMDRVKDYLDQHAARPEESVIHGDLSVQIQQLVDLVTHSDPQAVERCTQLMDHPALDKRQRDILVEVNRSLDEFEFEGSLEKLRKI